MGVDLILSIINVLIITKPMPYLLALFLIAFSSIALAQIKYPCAAQNESKQINECAKVTLASEDKKLNAAYQQLLKSLQPGPTGNTANYENVKKQLIEAQRSWIRFRDADCKGKLTLSADSVKRGEVYIGCLTERTEQRTNELLSWRL